MIKQDLQDYRAICLEISQLSKELASIGYPLQDGEARDCASGKARRPGQASGRKGKKARDLAGELKGKLEMRMSLLFRIEQEFENIEDTQIAVILRGRYMQGLSWKKLAYQMGGGNTEDSIRMRAVRFWKSCENIRF